MTEYHSNGSIRDILNKMNAKYAYNNLNCMKKGKHNEIKSVGIPFNQARKHFIEMLKAIYYCHNVAKVIHREIKPDNIMINHNQEAVLMYFGFSFIHY